MTTTSSRTAPASTNAVVTTVAVLALLGTLGSAIMALAHAGVRIPVLGIAPGVIVPAAIGFAVGTLLYGVVAFGVLRRASWAWAVGLAVNALAFASAVMPWRGPISGVAGGVSLLAVVLLVSRPGREGLLRG